MPTYKDADGRWRYRQVVRAPDGTPTRISGTAPKQANTRAACEATLAAACLAVADPVGTAAKRKRHSKAPTLDEWWSGRYWSEHVLSKVRKPSYLTTMALVYRRHLAPKFGSMGLDEIDTVAIAKWRADLIASGLASKSVNNTLGTLSTPLRYAVEVGVIAGMPKIGMLKDPAPPVVPWEFEELAKILAAARVLACKGSPPGTWPAAVLLACDAGLRAGEIKELRWREDVDLVAGVIKVQRATYQGKVDRTKGGERRAVPMTARLASALRSLDVVRDGLVIRQLTGRAWSTDPFIKRLGRILESTGLESKDRRWHALRHTFATDLARFGVNPWTLMTWLGHKRLDETMLYVHHAATHSRPTPPACERESKRHDNPDRRALAMVGVRGDHDMPDRARLARDAPRNDKPVPNPKPVRAKQ